MRLRGRIVGTVLLGGALVSCGRSDDTPIAQSTWQIVSVYVDEQHPSVLPDSIAGQATMVFGDSTIAGYTGCAPFRSQVEFFKGDATADPKDADRVLFENIKVDETDCEGAQRYYHDSLTNMLEGGFDMQRKAGSELLLVKQTDAFDRPAIRLSSISSES